MIKKLLSILSLVSLSHAAVFLIPQQYQNAVLSSTLKGVIPISLSGSSNGVGSNSITLQSPICCQNGFSPQIVTNVISAYTAYNGTLVPLTDVAVTPSYNISTLQNGEQCINGNVSFDATATGLIPQSNFQLNINQNGTTYTIQLIYYPDQKNIAVGTGAVEVGYNAFCSP